MKTILFALIFCFTFNALADCAPAIEADLVKKITSQKRLAKGGKIATGATFVTFAGFWGTMGVIMTGPLWAGVVIGSTFGAAAAIPVGATFIIINKVKKDRIKNLGKTLNIMAGGDELDVLLEKLQVKHPELTRGDLFAEITKLNDSGDLCNGLVAHYEREGRSKKRLSATPKDIERYIDDVIIKAPVLP